MRRLASAIASTIVPLAPLALDVSPDGQKVVFVVGADRSRTWVITRVTMYGGMATSTGSAWSPQFTAVLRRVS